MADSDGDLWDVHAKWWQDEFTGGVDPEYEEQILPLATQLFEGRRRVLDLGTGEGQLARRLVATSTPEVVGVDPSWSQIAVAAERASGPMYGLSDAAALPFADCAFDAAVACLVFEHIDDIESPIAELHRVLESGARFALFLNHPMLQTPGSGWIDDHMVDPPQQYWRLGPYLTESAQVEEVHKDVFIRFVHRPLSRYVNTLAGSGFHIREMYEPAPPEGFLAKSEYYRAAAAIPRLMVIVCERL